MDLGHVRICKDFWWFVCRLVCSVPNVSHVLLLEVKKNNPLLLGDLLGIFWGMTVLWVVWLFHTQLVVMFFNKSQLTMLLSLSLSEYWLPLTVGWLSSQNVQIICDKYFPETRRIDRWSGLKYVYHQGGNLLTRNNKIKLGVPNATNQVSALCVWCSSEKLILLPAFRFEFCKLRLFCVFMFFWPERLAWIWGLPHCLPLFCRRKRRIPWSLRQMCGRLDQDGWAASKPSWISL